MKKLAYALIVVVLIGAVAWGLITYNSLLQARSEMNSLHREIRSLEMNLEIAEGSLAKSKEDLTSARQELSSAKSSFEALESELELYRYTFGEVYPEGASSVVRLQAGPGRSRSLNLVNNPSASDPTWAELRRFLQSDRTDTRDYITDVYVCGHFAEDLHNNAEEQGIRAAFVIVEFAIGVPHALNAFRTRDRGLVYIDVTGVPPSTPRPSSGDGLVKLELRRPYQQELLFAPGWTVEALGGVTRIEVYW